MAAATSDRNTERRAGNNFAFPVKGGARIFTGVLVVLSGSYALNGRPGTGLVCVGIAEETVDNTNGPDGAQTVKVRSGALWRFDNSGGADQITLADVGANAYIVDDQTVAKTDGGNARSVAGKVRDVDTQGVWIAL
ncbi:MULTISPECIES: hypothetical protein [Ralstonia solanacearum species complex]|uniref:virion structural protein n=1 Tax=Ralstonia phage RS138 TaxID=1483485 RepID=UPI0006BD4F14|nr:hypothetical protein [Ralstonia solanacearum]YP_009226542.1 virion structural protein [Ralstonia phage RS138]BEU73981.1 hypothetical protein MAFF211271_35360 [Ralstonia pseudosolanacearum]AXV78893.1 hypothetical protein CJO76_18000 [Ralstonia solanacearum]AXV92915.1 hypothetical protein CJO79_17985 [Ralstonia solanacearum]AXW20978.1 hypothetical protein CJO85_18030 [Ralstonia solanacearum]AXW77813.1 hypothetical protein CJO97_17980 [Ralstonia solanacearum]